MNGKKAKLLRQITKKQTVNNDWPEVAYQQTNKRVKPYWDAAEREVKQYETHTLVLGACKRKFTKELKKLVKRDGHSALPVSL